MVRGTNIHEKEPRILSCLLRSAHSALFWVHESRLLDVFKFDFPLVRGAEASQDEEHHAQPADLWFPRTCPAPH